MSYTYYKPKVNLKKKQPQTFMAHQILMCSSYFSSGRAPVACSGQWTVSEWVSMQSSLISCHGSQRTHSLWCSYNNVVATLIILGSEWLHGADPIWCVVWVRNKLLWCQANLRIVYHGIIVCLRVVNDPNKEFF